MCHFPYPLRLFALRGKEHSANIHEAEKIIEASPVLEQILVLVIDVLESHLSVGLLPCDAKLLGYRLHLVRSQHTHEFQTSAFQ